jgi:predicted RNA-binding Zn ribbon-like protein
MVTAVSQIVALPNRVPKSEFVAGRLCLAFCNTVALPDAADRFDHAAGLAAWALRAGYPLDGVPGPADFDACITLRSELRAIFEALADGKPPPQAALDWLSGINLPPRLVWDKVAGRARPIAAGGRLDQLRQALVADAVDLLTGTAQARIKRCPAHDCRWFFFDTSRNGTRRWCAMADCGVKDKVRRFRRKQPAF